MAANINNNNGPASVIMAEGEARSHLVQGLRGVEGVQGVQGVPGEVVALHHILQGADSVHRAVLASLSPGLRPRVEGELLLEEGVQVLLLEPHHQPPHRGVEEVRGEGGVAGHLAGALAQPRHRVKQVAVRTPANNGYWGFISNGLFWFSPEHPVGTEDPWGHLLADVEL